MQEFGLINPAFPKYTREVIEMAKPSIRDLVLTSVMMSKSNPSSIEGVNAQLAAQSVILMAIAEKFGVQLDSDPSGVEVN